SYDMGMIREHIEWYHQMMDLMQQKNPDNVRIVHYEDMVENPTAALKVAADLCGLKMPKNPNLSVGDDRGCAEPYRDMMSAI
ncbi:MAG: sulfotransferase domain-containing protein, partial [Hyphomicrobiales bacterium]